MTVLCCTWFMATTEFFETISYFPVPTRFIMESSMNLVVFITIYEIVCLILFVGMHRFRPLCAKKIAQVPPHHSKLSECAILCDF